MSYSEDGKFAGLQESPIDLFDEHPNVKPNKRADYNAKSASGAVHVQGEEVHQGYSNQGQSVAKKPQAVNKVGGVPGRAVKGGNTSKGGQANGNQTGGNRPQGGATKQQAGGKPQKKVVRNQQPSNGVGQLPQEGGIQPKKKSKLTLIALVIVLVVGALFGVKMFMGMKQEPAEQVYETSGRYALDMLQNGLLTYDAVAIDAVVGVEDGDSWLAQEWAYVNNVKLRQEFLKKVGGIVKFTYPKVPQLSTKGDQMTDSGGNPIMIDSYMNAGESVTVTIPDYATLCQTMDEEVEYIQRMYKSYIDTRSNAYSLHDDMFNLMMQYLCDKAELPTKDVEVKLDIRLNTAGVPYILDDAPLDDVLFGSEEFRQMSEKFSQVACGWTGFKEEKYTKKEEQHNEEFDAWYEKFIVLYEADGGTYDPVTHTFSGGKFSKGKSKWEPWYLRDENNVIQKDENGENIVNYFSIKDDNGNDWIQPDEIIYVDVEKTRQIDDPWVREKLMYWNNLGVHYIQTAYDGAGSRAFRVGDGSVENPAGIGTPIITKAIGADGKYHDVEVTLEGYWKGEDAINYAEKFSERNRGFTTVSVVQLITFEVTIKNLEDVAVTIDSEMTLCDRNANISSRTGTMYGFSNEGITLEPGESIMVNDWASSTELEQKYACWGRTFGRQFSTVYFDCLAGTGVIPSYSAYEQFSGTGQVTKSAE